MKKASEDICDVPLIATLYYKIISFSLAYFSFSFILLLLMLFKIHIFQSLLWCTLRNRFEVEVDCIIWVSFSGCLQVKKYQHISEAWLPFGETGLCFQFTSFKAETAWKHSIFKIYAKCCIWSSCSPGTKRRASRVWCWCWIRSEESHRCRCFIPEFKALLLQFIWI